MIEIRISKNLKASFKAVVPVRGGVSRDEFELLAQKVKEKQDAISDLEDIRKGAEKGVTAVQRGGLSLVAISGNYKDLTNRPTIPSAVTESTVSGWGFTKNAGTYIKPNGGIPESDLAKDVLSKINKDCVSRNEYKSLSDKINSEIGRATQAEAALQKQIDEIPTTGGGGTGEIADGAVTEQKLSSSVKNKLNTAYDKANLADTLFVNDGITFIQGGYDSEGNDFYPGTNAVATSLAFQPNGERITVNDGYVITRYFLMYNGDAVDWSDVRSNYYDTGEFAGTEELGLRIEIRKSDNTAINASEYPNIVKSFIRKPIAWSTSCNMNNFVCSGRYTISGSREANANDNIPIYNGGNIEARLEVLENGNTLVQILSLLNVGGGDGNIYTRTRQDNTWGQWGKLQTNVEVGLIGVGQSKTFDDFTDNGMYSGVNAYWVDAVNYITSVETFVLVVINAYLYGGGIAQLKYSTLLDGTTTVKIRTRVDGSWTDWQGIGGGSTDYTLPVATTNILGGGRSFRMYGRFGTNVYGEVFALNVSGDGIASVTIPRADDYDGQYGLVKVDTSINPESKNPVSGKAVAEAIYTSVVNQTTTTATIAPNVLNVWGEVSSLDITLGEGKDGVINEYMFQFTSGATATTLVLPADIKWVSAPNIQANKIYQVSIINNLGVIGEFSHE